MSKVGFDFGSGGSVSEGGAIHVPLREVEGKRLGVYVDPLPVSVSEEIDGPLTTWQDDREELRMPAELQARLREILVDRIKRWDEGLVGHEGQPLSVSDPMPGGEGETALEAWVDYLFENRLMMAVRIVWASAFAIGMLEGNSRGPAASTGGTAPAEETASPPSTADAESDPEEATEPVAV